MQNLDSQINTCIPKKLAFRAPCNAQDKDYMFTLEEAKTRINLSNLSAFNQKGDAPKYPEGMLDLINTLHEYKRCHTKSSGIHGIWRPKDKTIFASNYCDLYRGAFARNSIGKPIAVGNRGATAIHSLFTNERLITKINDLLSLSRSNPAHLSNIAWKDNRTIDCSKEFWELCDTCKVSFIYRSKTLSMIFPDLFVPFDTNSKKQYTKDKTENMLPGISGRRPSLMNWAGYIQAHKSFQVLYNNISSHLPENSGNPELFLRNLSCYTDTLECREMFEDIVAKNFTTDISPPPVTRFIDNLCYKPAN